ncbi:hypothetical protein [Streptomyces sp. NPDC002265]|uniref:hypothetical protein n=1 Tax=Streptomyces sp. NPDC002265 TaxID=3154415 RepID=UPI00332DE97B
MRWISAAVPATAVLLPLAGCSDADAPTEATGAAGKPASPMSQAARKLDAGDVFTQISAQISSAHLTGTVTAADDPNHLLGRPHQYTSKITFPDGRIKPSDVEGTDKDDVERGDAIEVFANAEDAQARAKYIQAITQSLPTLSEYDYISGAVLVRVSHYLPPTQAASCKTAADDLA